MCSIKDGRLETVLFRKKTDRNQHLPSSCHPKHTTRSIPVSLATRILRNCSNTEVREKRFGELKTLLLERDYNERSVDEAINKVKSLPRDMVLKKRHKKKETSRPVLATLYDPRLPALQNIQDKHWRSMKNQDQYLAQVFPEPPLVGFRRQRNLKDHIIRAKVPAPAPQYPKRERKGIVRCGKCSICPFIREGTNIKIQNKPNWSINKRVDCNSTN